MQNKNNCVRDSDPLGRRLAMEIPAFAGMTSVRLRFMRLGGNGVNRATHKI